MKYINTRLSLFDTCSFKNYFGDANNGGGFTNGEGKISLPAETTKLYVSMELYTTTNILSSCDCWPLQIYFSDGAYNTIKMSTIQIYVGASNYFIELYTNDTKRMRTPYTLGIWHKVYLVIDSVAGTIDFFFDGDKVGTYDGYVKTGVKAISCKIKLGYYNNSYYTKARNIIISDQYFPPNEEVTEIPTTITSDGWEGSGDEYSTETENSTLMIESADLSEVLNGYKVTACNVGMGTTGLGDTIKNIKCDMGNYSNTKEIPATGKGMYFDGLPTSINNITITAKK